MKPLTLALLLSTAAAPLGAARADLLRIEILGHLRDSPATPYTSVWLAETGCSACDYQTGTGDHYGPSPILSASLTTGGTTVTYLGGSGTIYAYDDMSVIGGKLVSSFSISITLVPGTLAMTQSIDFTSIDLPGNLNVPFDHFVLPGDSANAVYAFNSPITYLTPERVTLTNLSAVPRSFAR